MSLLSKLLSVGVLFQNPTKQALKAGFQPAEMKSFVSKGNILTLVWQDVKVKRDIFGRSYCKASRTPLFDTKELVIYKGKIYAMQQILSDVESSSSDKDFKGCLVFEAIPLRKINDSFLEVIQDIGSSIANSLGGVFRATLSIDSGLYTAAGPATTYVLCPQVSKAGALGLLPAGSFMLL